MWTVKLYRDDSTTPVVYEHVKHVFWTASNSVLVIAQYDEPPRPILRPPPMSEKEEAAFRKHWASASSADPLVVAPDEEVDEPRHHYLHWPRERFAWYRLDRA